MKSITIKVCKAIQTTLKGGTDMTVLLSILKLLLKIIVAPVILALTLFIWICVGGIDYLFSAKWTYLAVDCLFDKSLRSANGSNLAVGKGTGLKVCYSGFSV